MRTRTAFLLPLALGLAGAGCASSNYLARVNEETITGKELRAEFTKRHGGHGSFLAGPVEARKFLDLVIDQRLLIQEAYRLDLGKQSDIEKAVGNFEEQKAAEYFVRVEIDDKAQTSADDVQRAWERNTARLYQAGQIVLDTRAEADSVYFRLASGADFEAEARSCSIAASRIYGGNLPFLGWGAMDPPWEDAVFGMTPGEVSAPFPTADGWEIVVLHSIEAPDRPDFAKAAKRIEGILKKRRLDARKRELSDYLWSKYRVRRSEADLGPEALHETLGKSPDAPIAAWDGGTLSFKEFASQVDWSSIAGDLPGRFRAEIEEQLRRIVNEPLSRREAKERQYEKVPVVAEAVRAYREELMEGALYADYVLKKVTVTDEELKAWYADHAADFVEPEKRRIAHIVVPARDDAEEIRRKLAEGEPFEALVKTKSTDTASQKQMGDLGWVTKKEATGGFEKVFDLAAGDYTEPIESKFGYHVMRVTKIVPARPLEFEEAREAIRKKVFDRKQRETRALWIKKLREAATIRISDAGIRGFVNENKP